jgi:uncharacterized protein
VNTSPPPRPRSGRLQSAAIGAIAGLLNGLVALGGGIIVTPMLIGQRGVAPQSAVGTSLAVVTVLSSIGFVAHFAFGGLILGPTAILASVLGGVIGAAIGSRLLAHVTARWMLLMFAWFVFVVAARLIGQGLGLSIFPPAVAEPVPLLAFLLLGGFSGLLSGVFGVGGGALVLLGLAAFYDLPIQEGLPIALALNVSNALFGLVHHMRAGRVLWPEVRVLIPTAVVGIGVGAWLALRLPPDMMRIVFGAFFLFMGARIAHQGWRLKS